MGDTAEFDLLIVEDDQELGSQVEAFLRGEGFNVARAMNVADGRRLFARVAPQICLLDIVMPGPTGRMLCREIAAGSDAAVIMMSSLSDTETVISLLESGADDYIIKPFANRELLARIRSVLRRRQKTVPATTNSPRIGPWLLDPQDKRLRHDEGFSVTLTESEVGLLRFMAANPGVVFSREDLLAVARMRQPSGPEDRALDMLVRRLRKKIEEDAQNPKLLVTAWGRGFRLGT